MRYQGPDLLWYEAPCEELQDEIDVDYMLDQLQDQADHDEELYNMMMG